MKPNFSNASALRYGSVCSGIEAASVAWQPLGWQAAWFSEIEAFPCTLLAQHYPATPNMGDMTRLPELILNGSIEAPDILVGGTPCQAFSLAGLRHSLNDARGNLTLTFVEIANAIDTIRTQNNQSQSIVIWENVPGVLNTRDNAFGCFLGALAGHEGALIPTDRHKWSKSGCVYGPTRNIAWRVLDAQYFGLAQRRKRVFVIACARSLDPSEILFEWERVHGNTAPSFETGQGVACHTAKGIVQCDWTRTDGLSQGFNQSTYSGYKTAVITNTLLAKGGSIGHGSETLIIHAVGIGGNIIGRAPEQGGNGLGFNDEIAPTLTVRDIHAVSFDLVQITNPHNSSRVEHGLPASTLSQTSQMHVAICHEKPYVEQPHYIVRRLTPRECERLQGFSDDYTLIHYRGKPASDSPRYKALGNSMAVPVMRWIGERIVRLLNTFNHLRHKELGSCL